MYRITLRVYPIGDQVRAYAELYEQDGDEQEPLATAHTSTYRSPDARYFTHPDIEAAIQAVCTELSGNFEATLF